MQFGMKSAKENTAPDPVQTGRGRGKEKQMKHYFEKESQCRTEADKDLVLERGTDGEVTELIVADEEDEADADHD